MRLVYVFCLIPVLCFGQKMTREQYIEKYKDIAIREMKKTGIPASITLAQGLLESGNGNSDLATKANNHFGIKCHSNWKGKGFYKDDDAKDECFRVYKDPEESYRDHSDFLVNGSRYDFLFELKLTDYKGWAKGLKKAGYATNPKYPDLLIRIIKENELYKYDTGKGGKRMAEVKSQTGASPPPGKVDYSQMRNPYYESPEIMMHKNHIKFYEAKAGETYQDIASKFKMRMWQLEKYNELPPGVKAPEAGDIVFLQPKRRKAQEQNHIVRSGETVYEISQEYGIKTKHVYRLNPRLNKNEPLQPGTKLRLR